MQKLGIQRHTQESPLDAHRWHISDRDFGKHFISDISEAAQIDTLPIVFHFPPQSSEPQSAAEIMMIFPSVENILHQFGLTLLLAGCSPAKKLSTIVY